ncbi:MAG: lytic murein transglycosylase B [Oceanospirillaceae bacterium]
MMGSFKVLTNWLFLCIAIFSAPAVAATYEKHPEALLWMDSMVKEGFSKVYLEKVLKKAKRQNSILKAFNRPAESRLSWTKYRARFIERGRIESGNKFWRKHSETLAKAEQQFGVPAQMIVSIIGVETRYGKVTGSYRVLDALATIAFDYKRRSKFFQNELKEFLLLTKEASIPYTQPKGSYAGAMGYGQFIPSSYRKYAIDFDGDGKKDIWKNPKDAIGSVANYLAKHGWIKNSAVVVAATKVPKEIDKSWYNNGLDLKVTLGQWQKRAIKGAEKLDQGQKATLMKLVYDEKDQYWFGLQNFYVITRYNRSRYYAMAVYQLSQIIKAKNKSN